MRGGSHQPWIVDEPVKAVDQANGVSYRAAAYIAVRGFQRGRNLVLSKGYNTSDKPAPRVDDPRRASAS